MDGHARGQGIVNLRTDGKKTIIVTATPDEGYRLKSVKAFYAVKQDVSEEFGSWRDEDWGQYFHIHADDSSSPG